MTSGRKNKSATENGGNVRGQEKVEKIKGAPVINNLLSSHIFLSKNFESIRLDKCESCMRAQTLVTLF